LWLLVGGGAGERREAVGEKLMEEVERSLFCWLEEVG
jgi:hypothetical protein